MWAAVAVFSVRENDVLPGNFPSLEHCQKIRLARFRVEVLSFYLAVNFSYVSYISATQHTKLSSNHHHCMLSDQFSLKNFLQDKRKVKQCWILRMDFAQNKISRAVLQQKRVAAHFLCHVLSIFGPFCHQTCTFFSLFRTHISSQVMHKTCGTFLNMQWFYNVSRFNNLNFAFHWKGGNSVVILEWISQYFMYLVNEALRYWKFLWPTSALKIGMLQVSAATNMTLNTMFWSFMFPSDLLIISW